MTSLVEVSPLEAMVNSLEGYIKTGDVPLLERLSDLEVQLENAGWIRQQELVTQNEFSLNGLKTIARLARIFFLKNPLIQRGVNVQADYTFGRGITISANDEEINTVIQAFIDDLKNQVEITAHQSMLQKDRELQLDGNIFLCFMVHETTGHVRVRSISFQELGDYPICNPDDSKEPWYYKRVWQQQNGDQYTEKTLYYRDWQYSGNDRTVLPENAELAPDNYFVFHIKDGGFSDWRLGVSSVYAALDWARSYKDFLSNWATLMRAYSRFAMKLETKGGAAGVARTKDRLQTTLGQTNGVESNPPASTASTFVASDQIALDVVKTAGATTKAEEGRRLLLMVAAAQGLPETFYGDVSVGTLATAESLDRPTELKFSNRQEFWQSVYKRIVHFVIKCNVAADSGELGSIGRIETNEYGEDVLVFGDGIKSEITIKFPEIINISIKDHVQTVISAASLDGKSIKLLNPRMVTEYLLIALGVDDVDEKLEALFPDGINPAYVPPTPMPMEPNEKQSIDTNESLSVSINRLIEAMKRYE
jgi:hypothetical protein